MRSFTKNFVIALTLVALISIASSASFAAVKACGQIKDYRGSLVFVQTLNGHELPSTSIYPSPRLTPEQQKIINVRLHGYVNFREVCVAVSTTAANEGDTVIMAVVSVQE